MAALGVGKVAEGSGVARDGSGRRDSGRSCGGAGASRRFGNPMMKVAFIYYANCYIIG